METKRKIERFEDLVVWQKAKNLGLAIYRVSASGNFAKDYTLKNQIRRAALSISSNIAEGQGRFGTKEFKNYLSIANGSVYEVISQTHFARDLDYLTPMEAEDILVRCSEVSRMVKGLRNSI